MIQTIRNYRAYRNALHDLRRMSEPQLTDIGVPRWRLKEVARGAAVNPAQVV